MDLVFVLLNATRPLSKGEIFQRVPGYGDPANKSDVKTFDRDKDELRNLQGIPIETVKVDTYDASFEGYTLDASWLLPEMRLTPRERAYIALAETVWENHQIASAAHDAGLHMGTAADPIAMAAAGQPAVLGDLFEAIADNRVVEFTYHSKRGDRVASRRVEPWRLFCTGGAWYMVGFDLDALDHDGAPGARRIFRLSRLLSAVVQTAEVATHPAPHDLDIRALVAGWVDLPGATVTALLRLPAGECGHLRVQAHAIDPEGPGFDLLTITYEFEEPLARAIASACDRVVVVSPDSLRVAVTNLIEGACG